MKMDVKVATSLPGQETRLMFFRMVKKDLRESKGLNVIIFLFMIIVSALAAASGFLLYVNLSGMKVTEERVNPHDFCALYVMRNRDIDTNCREEAIMAEYPDATCKHLEGIRLDYTNMRYEGMDQDDDTLRNSLTTCAIMLTTQTFDMDLMYTEDNQPFYVENGNIAIAGRFAALTGLKVGDKLQVITQMGNIFEFNISHITRDPSMDYVYRMIISESDYELMSKESPAKYGMFLVQTNEERDIDETEIASVLTNYKPLDDYPMMMFQGSGITRSNQTIVSMLVSFFLLIASIFMLLVVFFALGFTIRAAIKKEERELGIMKALGTDSISFRWLFAAKYIAFAVVGSLIGCIIGLIGAGKMVDQFFYNISYVFGAMDYIIAIVSAICVTGFVILYILHAMKRINKISVMDAIRGEAIADRSRHSGRFQLNRRGRMPISLYLALTDVFGNFKKYVLLFIAFTAGSIVVLTSIMFRDTVISPDFMYKYYTFKEMDFVINMTDKTINELSLGTERNDIIMRQFDKLMEKENIPARIEFIDMQDGKIVFDNSEEIATIYYNADPEGMRIRDGGQYPKLRNEILIDYFTAEEHDLHIGDKVTLEYNKLSEDRLSSKKTKEEFVITGFLDRLSAINTRDVFMSAEFKDAAVGGGGNVLSYKLDCPEKDKDQYRARLKELFPDDYMSDTEFISAMLGLYNTIFSFMRNIFVIVVAGVLAFLVVMYQTIFMKDEESEIALLTSTGFDDRTTKGWHILRMMLLFTGANVLAIILAPTLISWLTGALFHAMLGLTGWRITGGFGLSVLWVIFISVVTFVVITLVARKIEKIEVWRIRNE